MDIERERERERETHRERERERERERPAPQSTKMRQQLSREIVRERESVSFSISFLSGVRLVYSRSLSLSSLLSLSLPLHVVRVSLRCSRCLSRFLFLSPSFSFISWAVRARVNHLAGSLRFVGCVSVRSVCVLTAFDFVSCVCVCVWFVAAARYLLCWFVLFVDFVLSVSW